MKYFYSDSFEFLGISTYWGNGKTICQFNRDEAIESTYLGIWKCYSQMDRGYIL